jgi:hypothetical protein
LDCTTGWYSPTISDPKRRQKNPLSRKKSPRKARFNLDLFGQTLKKAAARGAAAFVDRSAVFEWSAVLEGMISKILLHPARQKKKSPYRHFLHPK